MVTDGSFRLQPVSGGAWTAGTGGALLYDIVAVQPNSERFYNSSFGVLKLTLQSGAYQWEFLSTDSQVVDSGTAACVR